jgi:hypothetical protein
MKTAAPDFRLFWDNAYAVHHLTLEKIEIEHIDAASHVRDTRIALSSLVRHQRSPRARASGFAGSRTTSRGF